MNVDVTVCVMSLNRPAFLTEALHSVLRQTVSPKTIAVFDAGSTPEILASLKKEFTADIFWHSSERLLLQPENFARACSWVKTKYFLVLHDDDRLADSFLEHQINYLEQNPDVIAVTCNGRIINSSSEYTGDFVRPGFVETCEEHFSSNTDVAASYAQDICLPMSPMLYVRERVAGVTVNPEYGNAFDAVFICSLAGVGTIAYRAIALYDCRYHPSQVSAYYTDQVLQKLDDYFWALTRANKVGGKRLHYLLVRQQNTRIIQTLYNTLFRGGAALTLWKLSWRRFSTVHVISISTTIIISRVINMYHYILRYPKKYTRSQTE